MEAMLNLQDKWNLTTQQALLLFACTAFALIGFCTATLLKRKAHRKQMASQDPAASDTYQLRYNNWVRIKRMLMESLRWSKANKWEEKRVRNLGETSPLPLPPQPQPLLAFEDCESSVSFDLASQSRNSVSPVWQRPILMGEKCELPRFSGLILYDERGRLLDHSLASAHKENLHHEKRAAVLTTTLRDLL